MMEERNYVSSDSDTFADWTYDFNEWICTVLRLYLDYTCYFATFVILLGVNVDNITLDAIY